jgi:MFS family permease
MTSTTSSDTRRPRLSPHYWRLWRANAISSTGDGAFVAALPLLAVTISRDPRLVAVVTAAGFFPWMVLSLPAGALVDRYDRATLMWRAQAVQAAVVAVVAVAVIFRIANIAVLGLAGLLLGSAEVVFSNAAQAVLPDLVPPELLARANGSQQVSLTVGETFLGPPAGSLLFAVAAALPFGLDALSFAGSAAQLAGKPASRRSPSAPGSPKGCAGCTGTACCASSPSCSASSTSATRWARPSWCCWPPRRCTSGPAGTGCCWR